MSDIEHPRITEVGRLLAENDRLREALMEAQEVKAELDRQLDQVCRERNRLREALLKAHDLLTDVPFRGSDAIRVLTLITEIRAALAKEV